MITAYDPEPLLAAVRAAGGPEMQELFSGYRDWDEGQEPFVWIVAGTGEIQYYTDGELGGQAWFLTWDRTHAISYEEELTIPDSLSTEDFARWLVSEAKARNEVDICLSSDRDGVMVAEIGPRAFYTSDKLEDIIPRIRQARIFAIREARRQTLLRRNPQD